MRPMKNGETREFWRARHGSDAPDGWQFSEGCPPSVHDQFSRPIERDPMTELPQRVQILHEGAALTNGDRDQEYGTPFNNMTCAGELKAVFRKWLARDISPGELEALDMVMTKLSRLACGKPKRDTYVDAATYIAIAGEVAGQVS